MVLRTMPVMRAISRWRMLRSSSVKTVARWLGFKTFTPWPSFGEDRTNVLPTGASGAGVASCPRSTQVEEFEVAISGGIWVAIGATWSI
jgi:hypothetical protein